LDHSRTLCLDDVDHFEAVFAPSRRQPIVRERHKPAKQPKNFKRKFEPQHPTMATTN